VQGGSYSNRPVFGIGNAAKFNNKRRVAGCSKSNGFRPFREVAAKQVAANKIVNSVARVGADGNRNAEPGLFCNFLNGIVPRGQLS